MNPVKSSLRYPIVVLVLAAMVVAVGVNALLTMPRTEDPGITIREGLVLAWYPGATSEQVEQQVTSKIEEHIFKFPEVRKEKTYSTSRPGVATVLVVLEDHVKDAPAFWAKLRDEMNETGAMELPKGVLGPLVNSDFGDTVAMLVAVHGERYGYRELHDYTDRIKDELRTIRDVGKLATYGDQSEQIRITSSLERMSQYFADPLRVIQALQQRNVIQSSGAVDAGSDKVPLRTTGLFTTEDQIRNVMVDVSRTGQPVYIRDFASVERLYQDPSFVVRYDGQPSILLSIEMQEGRNIVQLGDEIAKVFERLRTILPPDLQLDLVANQPAVVAGRMKSLGYEFLLAIGAVILVTVLLLPLRVAVTSAVAIPVTICTTLGILNFIGVQLHQVSIAALIVVLGIVVDDAIVIADNYVDCLDRGMTREEAAWKCVGEVIVPVLTATLTIIASFLPLLILAGSVGEFIQALPITVAVALGVSFVVAIFLTPLLCRFFIRKGLHDHSAPGDAPAKTGMLDRLQSVYNTSIGQFMRHKWLAVVLGVIAVAGGVTMYVLVPDQFFPSAERNQFVIDVWMPQGARVEATDAVMRRIEKSLASRDEVAHCATFLGQSAPRFYYNVNPQLPDAAYGQFIVNTKSEKTTPALVSELRTSLARVAPEALVLVKELQQGEVMEAPVEVRISGYDVPTLKQIGRQVEGFLRDVPFAEMVHSDFFNDSYFVNVDVNTEVSNRMGLSNAIISQTLAGAFSGAPVSTFWEGDRAVNIVLRLDPAYRESFEDVRNAYLTSPITHARVPLRSVANLDPKWQTSRIVRRNGVRTLTVRAYHQHGHYASDILKAVDPRIKALSLPPGYSIRFGGERTNSGETMPQLIAALSISLVAIFLVLLIQFRTLSEPLIVMASIPLTLFGAMLGLLLTQYPFGFTAFTGLISLCGIVVRNAIILVDYIKERLRDGHSLVEAATEAGERRLRPIFLTTMAAAVGVTPMILSGSGLWGPLASVIAVGLITSMFFTLIVVPVLYVLVESRARRKATQAAVVALAAILLSAMPAHAGTRSITLPEAIDLARKQNTALKIARARLQETQARTTSARSNYYPHISNETMAGASSSSQLVTVPAGALGTIPPIGPFPVDPVTFDQGSKLLMLGSTTAGQPITQLFKIRQAVRVAKADERISEAEFDKAEDDVILGVHQLYYGLLAARAQVSALEAQVTAGNEALREAGDAVRSGNVLEVAVMGARASLLKTRQALLAARNQADDLNGEMTNLLGLPLDTELDLAEVTEPPAGQLAREEYLKSLLERNPELRAAKEQEQKAESAVLAARYEYIPDIGAFARHTYQSGVPFLDHNFGTFGFQMNWNIFDWGKRKSAVNERQAQRLQARENVRRITDRLSVDIDKAWRKLERTRMMMDVANEALALRRESERISGDQLRAGVISQAKNAEAVAATRSAQADALQARLAHYLALAEIAKVAGTVGQ
ncbi:MAG: efflux RND transporter permease subunit [Bryobacterales bacterium]|nr:efflux RND transporter permease subunit [Bryobacterales bacterium]